MGKDFREVAIGVNPPFSIRNATKNIIKIPIEAECSSFRIFISKTNGLTDCKNAILSNKLKYLRQKDLQDGFSTSNSGILISGFIIKKGTKIPIAVEHGVPNITFSCFDEIHLHFFKKNSQTLFFAKFNCCKNWGLTKLRAHEVAWIGNNFSPSSDFIEVPIEILNLRSGYHYNVSEVRLEDNRKYISCFNFEINNTRFTLEGYKCPLCLQPCSYGHKSLELIASHINLIHKRYSAEVKDDILEIACNYQKKDQKQSRRPFVGPYSKKMEYNQKSVDSIEFDTKYELGSSEERQPRPYVDFIAGMASEHGTLDKIDEGSGPETLLLSDSLEAENQMPNNSLKLADKELSHHLNSTIISEMYDFVYYSAEDPGGLAKQISLSKESRRSPFCKKKLVEFFYINDSFSHYKSSTPRPISKKLYGSASCYIKAAFFPKRPPSGKDFGYFKSRDSKLLEYSFINYGLHIEKEFDSLDYSSMLSSHLSLRLKDKYSSLNPKEFKLMTEWNYLRLRIHKIPDCIRCLTKAFGLTNEVLSFIEILYNRGIITSSDIIYSLSE